MVSRHRRAGPARTRRGVIRVPGTKPVGAVPVPRKNDPRQKAKALPMPKKKEVPKPVGPWMAMRSILHRLVPAEDQCLMLDVGAHLGNVTEMLLKLHPNPYVVCFEPYPPDVKALLERFPASAAPVSVAGLALGSKSGQQTFHVCGQGTEMSSLLPRGDYEDRRYYRHEVRETIKVPVTTLDEWWKQYDLEYIPLLKMDVQGGEKLVLSGAKQILKDNVIDLIYSEVMFAPMYKGAWEFWEMCRYLAKYDYSLFDIYGLQRSWVSRQLKYADALWVSPRVREGILNQYPEEWLAKSLPYRMCPER